MTELPEGYRDCMSAMNEAAAAFMRARPFAQPVFRLDAFERDVKRQAGRPDEDNVAIAVPLAAVVDRIAKNEDARQLLRAMVAVAEPLGGATYMMAKVLIEAQYEVAVARNQGQLTGDADWHCPCCGKLLDGFSNLSFDGQRPGPGTLTVCAYCYANLQVKDGGGYLAVSKAELLALEPEARKMLERAGQVVRKMAADRRKRS